MRSREDVRDILERSLGDLEDVLGEILGEILLTSWGDRGHILEISWEILERSWGRS